MSAPDIDMDVLTNFESLGADNSANLTIILGAGASATSGLPLWDEFATRLLVKSAVVRNVDDANTLLRIQEHTIALSAARIRAGDEWPRVVSEALYGSDEAALDTASPSPLHLAAAAHYLAHPSRTTLATLNYDVLLEKALIGSEGVGSVRIGAGGRTRQPGAVVHHLHGVVFGGGTVDPIVDYIDYADLVADAKAWQRTFVHEQLSDGPLLLAGTSFRDPDIRHWLHQALADGNAAHPALVTIAREGLGISSAEFERVREALTAEWQAIGISALLMEDLADVARVIRELGFLAKPEYKSPRKRAQDVWDSHERNFQAIQRRYGEELAEDSRRVSEALNAPVHQGSLWLWKAPGALAKFATTGTRFASVNTLKTVPTGHDSPWIAGESLSREEVQLKGVCCTVR